jgi:hypothetical protein
MIQPLATCCLQLGTFWQSDGHAPHSIVVSFEKRTTVVGVALYLDFEQDESYTPAKVRVSEPRGRGGERLACRSLFARER